MQWYCTQCCKLLINVSCSYTNVKSNNFTASIPSYVNSTIQPETINNRLASQLNINGSTALIKVPVGSKANNQSLHPFEHHLTTNTLNQQTLNITNNNQTQTLHVINMRPYTKHSQVQTAKAENRSSFFCFVLFCFVFLSNFPLYMI